MEKEKSKLKRQMNKIMELSRDSVKHTLSDHKVYVLSLSITAVDTLLISKSNEDAPKRFVNVLGCMVVAGVMYNLKENESVIRDL